MSIDFGGAKRNAVEAELASAEAALQAAQATVQDAVQWDNRANGVYDEYRQLRDRVAALNNSMLMGDYSDSNILSFRQAAEEMLRKAAEYTSLHQQGYGDRGGIDIRSNAAHAQWQPQSATGIYQQPQPPAAAPFNLSALNPGAQHPAFNFPALNPGAQPPAFNFPALNPGAQPPAFNFPAPLQQPGFQAGVGPAQVPLSQPQGTPLAAAPNGLFDTMRRMPVAVAVAVAEAAPAPRPAPRSAPAPHAPGGHAGGRGRSGGRGIGLSDKQIEAIIAESRKHNSNTQYWKLVKAALEKEEIGGEPWPAEFWTKPDLGGRARRLIAAFTQKQGGGRPAAAAAAAAAAAPDVQELPPAAAADPAAAAEPPAEFEALENFDHHLITAPEYAVLAPFEDDAQWQAWKSVRDRFADMGRPGILTDADLGSLTVKLVHDKINETLGDLGTPSNKLSFSQSANWQAYVKPLREAVEKAGHKPTFGAPAFGPPLTHEDLVSILTRFGNTQIKKAELRSQQVWRLTVTRAATASDATAKLKALTAGLRSTVSPDLPVYMTSAEFLSSVSAEERAKLLQGGISDDTAEESFNLLVQHEPRLQTYRPEPARVEAPAAPDATPSYPAVVFFDYDERADERTDGEVEVQDGARLNIPDAFNADAEFRFDEPRTDAERAFLAVMAEKFVCVKLPAYYFFSRTQYHNPNLQDDVDREYARLYKNPNLNDLSPAKGFVGQVKGMMLVGNEVRWCVELVEDGYASRYPPADGEPETTHKRFVFNFYRDSISRTKELQVPLYAKASTPEQRAARRTAYEAWLASCVESPEFTLVETHTGEAIITDLPDCVKDQQGFAYTPSDEWIMDDRERVMTPAEIRDFERDRVDFLRDVTALSSATGDKSYHHFCTKAFADFTGLIQLPSVDGDSFYMQKLVNLEFSAKYMSQDMIAWLSPEGQGGQFPAQPHGARFMGFVTKDNMGAARGSPGARVTSVVALYDALKTMEAELDSNPERLLDLGDERDARFNRLCAAQRDLQNYCIGSALKTDTLIDFVLPNSEEFDNVHQDDAEFDEDADDDADEDTAWCYEYKHVTAEEGFTPWWLSPTLPARVQAVVRQYITNYVGTIAMNADDEAQEEAALENGVFQADEVSYDLKEIYYAHLINYYLDNLGPDVDEALAQWRVAATFNQGVTGVPNPDLAAWDSGSVRHIAIAPVQDYVPWWASSDRLQVAAREFMVGYNVTESSTLNAETETLIDGLDLKELFYAHVLNKALIARHRRIVYANEEWELVALGNCEELHITNPQLAPDDDLSDADMEEEEEEEEEDEEEWQLGEAEEDEAEQPKRRRQRGEEEEEEDEDEPPTQRPRQGRGGARRTAPRVANGPARFGPGKRSERRAHLPVEVTEVVDRNADPLAYLDAETWRAFAHKQRGIRYFGEVLGWLRDAVRERASQRSEQQPIQDTYQALDHRCAIYFTKLLPAYIAFFESLQTVMPRFREAITLRHEADRMKSRVFDSAQNLYSDIAEYENTLATSVEAEGAEIELNPTLYKQTVFGHKATVTPVETFWQPERAWSLKPHQEQVVSKFMENIQDGVGLLIADEMGLGKTLASIACVERLAVNRGIHAKDIRVLILCPIPVGNEWKRQIERFTSYRYRNNNISTMKQKLAVTAVNKELEANNRNWYLINYEKLQPTNRRGGPDSINARIQLFKCLKKIKWDVVILDEVHTRGAMTRGRATHTELTSLFKSWLQTLTPAPGFLALTGTPVTRSIKDEMSALFSYFPCLPNQQHAEYWDYSRGDGYRGKWFETCRSPYSNIIRHSKRSMRDVLDTSKGLFEYEPTPGALRKLVAPLYSYVYTYEASPHELSRIKELAHMTGKQVWIPLLRTTDCEPLSITPADAVRRLSSMIGQKFQITKRGGTFTVDAQMLEEISGISLDEFEDHGEDLAGVEERDEESRANEANLGTLERPPPKKAFKALRFLHTLQELEGVGRADGPLKPRKFERAAEVIMKLLDNEFDEGHSGPGCRLGEDFDNGGMSFGTSDYEKRGQCAYDATKTCVVDRDKLSMHKRVPANDARKVLVFGMFTESLKAFAHYLKLNTDLGYAPDVLCGDTAFTDTTGAIRIVEQFQKTSGENQRDVLLVQLKTGGTGLNLQEASAVVFLDLYFVAADINQALARAWRIGQPRDVKVVYFCPKGHNNLPTAESIIFKDFIQVQNASVERAYQIIENDPAVEGVTSISPPVTETDNQRSIKRQLQDAYPL